MPTSRVISNLTKSSNAVELYRGQSKDLLLTLTEPYEHPEEGASDRAPNLTGATLYFTVRTTPEAADTIIRKTSDNEQEIEITAPIATSGQAVVHLMPGDTKYLKRGTYVFDVWIVTSTARHIPVVEVSEFIVNDPVTRI